MKIKNTLLHAAFVGGLIVTAQPGFAQGSLTPSGPPAPTMKTLTQVEPRVTVDALNTPGTGGAQFTISQPGSYYLTGNITGGDNYVGIEITTNNVTLDLNGFTIEGGAGNDYGILLMTPLDNVTVRNGFITGWLEGGVIDFGGAENLVLEHLAITESGFGIYATGSNTVVRNCFTLDNYIVGVNCSGSGMISDSTSRDNGNAGIVINGGSVTGCMVEGNGGYGIDCSAVTVSGCTVRRNDLGGIYSVNPTGLITGCQVYGNVMDGIDCFGGNVVACAANNNGMNGITVSSGIVSGCLVQANQGEGIAVGGPGSGAVVTGNTVIGSNPGGSTTGGGITVFASNNNRIDGNTVTGSGYAGINVIAGSGNVIIKNSVAGNGLNNYVVTPGNDLGPVGTAATSTSPWANISN